MPADTKERILNTARRLFNERGYARVSMRAIAEELDISPGNLTYHFPQKADIVTALMNELFDQTYLSEPILSMADLMDQFGRMLDTILINAFYFLDPEFSDSPRVHNQAIRMRIDDGLAYLVRTGVLVSSFTPEIRKTIVDILLMSHMSWLGSVVRGKASMSRQEFLDAHLMLFQPYLV